MMHSDDELATLDRLLGPELLALLDAFEAAETVDGDPSLADEHGATARNPNEERRGRRDELRADIAAELVLVRRRIEQGVPPSMRDELTMPLPFADLGGR